MATETLLPNELVSSVNLNVTLADVDEGVSNPDNVWATTSTNNGSTALTLGFPTPTAQLTTGAGLQTFRVRVRKNNTGGNNPTVRIRVLDNGVNTGTENTFTLANSTTGETLTFTWDATTITDAGGNIDGSGVQIAIEQQTGGTGQAAARRFVEIDSADWIADYTPPVVNNARSFAVFI